MTKEELAKIKKLERTMQYEVFEYHHRTTADLKELLEFLGFDDDLSYITNIDTDEVEVQLINNSYEVFDGHFVVKDQNNIIKVMSPYEYEKFEKECTEQNKTNKKQQEMTREELVELLYDNFYYAPVNAIHLPNLDFTKYNCGVDISFMKVNGRLKQNYQTVGKDLLQDNQEVRGDLVQSYCQVKGDLHQNNQTVDKDLSQDHQTVEEDLIEGNNKVKGKVYKHYF